MFDTMSSIALMDIDIITTSTTHVEGDEDPHTEHKNPSQDMIVTASTSDDKGDQEDIICVDEDLSQLDIEQVLEIVIYNTIQLPPRLDVRLNQTSTPCLMHFFSMHMRGWSMWKIRCFEHTHAHVQCGMGMKIGTLLQHDVLERNVKFHPHP